MYGESSLARWTRPWLVVFVAAIAWSAAFASSASAMFTSVFAGTAGMEGVGIACKLQTGEREGQRWCTGTPSQVRSWDGTPIDVAVALPPAPVKGADGNFPVVGIYHGWGGMKAAPGSANVQKFVDEGFAVFSMTDRGWGQSCGTLQARESPPKWGTCEHGYIHLDDQAYEARDAQYLLGQLADEGAIDPQRTGASGASYGGILSAQLAALNSRTRLPGGELVPWLSPHGLKMRTAAAIPQALASDISYALIPNGSTLDYVANSPYFGPQGNLPFGVGKYTIFNGFYGTTPVPKTRYYAPVGSDRSADIVTWHALSGPPGPFDDLAHTDAIEELTAMHSAYYVDDSQAPAPMLMASGFWDDFVPVDEAVRYYNRIRTDNPTTPVALFFGDLGHARSNDKKADAEKLASRQDAWLRYYVKGEGAQPQQGLETFRMTCPAGVPSEGPFTFTTYQEMEKGEVRIKTESPQTIQPKGTQYGTQLSQPEATACTTVGSADNPVTANYRTRVTGQAGGFSVAGSATVIAKLAANGRSDQIAARLLDVAPDGTERLVERGLFRPQIGAETVTQVFQLHPNVYLVAGGHQLKLELLPDDYPYSIQNSIAPEAAAQKPITVLTLELRVPTMDKPGAAEGLVKKPLVKFLPPGYRLAKGVNP